MQIDSKLIHKYNTSGPRYTSYPTALQFKDDFEQEHYIQALNSGSDEPISLYLHIPFCRNICYYCACNKVITKDTSKAEKYLQYLFKEAEQLVSVIGRTKVNQIHFGGGTPTFLSNQQLSEVMTTLRNLFEILPESEISIEIDPRTLAHDTLPNLQKQGFNRISIGVQDFNEKVQKAVNRINSAEMVRKVIHQARRHGFESINMDLIYGLPFQTLETVSQTLDQVITMAPDRLSLYNYAHLPYRFKPQRRINAEDLPDPEQKIAILQMAIEKLTGAGYVYIGMDHFALPHDELCQAQNNGTLHRNFQGYTTNSGTNLIGLGVSSISQFNQFYSQNIANLDDYYQKIDDEQLPIWRGCILAHDDLLRRTIIMGLISKFELDFATIEKAYDISFANYFSNELTQLKIFEDDGLLEISGDGIQVSEQGQFFIRNICMAFDSNLQEISQVQSYSKVI